MIESYARNAPRRHELRHDNFEVRRYACHEYGGRCGEWFVRESLTPNGHSSRVAAPEQGVLTSAESGPTRWQKTVPNSETY